MRYKKTPNSERKSYKYYFSDGTSNNVPAGENGVTAELIAFLHSLDDKEVNNNLKNRKMSLTENERELCKEKMEEFSDEDFFRSLELLNEEGFLADRLQSEDTYFADVPQDVEQLLKVVMSLSSLDKEIYRLVLINGYKYGEAADILGVKECTVGYHVKKIRKIIEEKINL